MKPSIVEKVAVSEKDFQRAVLDLAHTLGWKTMHFHDSRRQVKPGVFVGDTDAAGFPDLVLVRERVVYAEMKAESGRLSKAQLGWLEVLGYAGQEAYVWRPSSWEFIEHVLARHSLKGGPHGIPQQLTGRDS